MRVGSNLTSYGVNGVHLIGSNIKGSGDNCILVGSNIQWEGNQNVITGTNARVKGNQNQVTGSFATVTGNANHVKGYGAVAQGTDNIVLNEPDSSSGIVQNFFGGGGGVVKKKEKKKKREREEEEEEFVVGPSEHEVEHDKVAERTSCIICMERVPCCIALPCRDLKFCVTCARQLCFDGDAKNLKRVGQVSCPACRKSITSIERVFE